MTGRFSASPSRCATSLPSEPISRVMAIIGMSPPRRLRLRLAIQLFECTPLAIPRVAGAVTARLHAPSAVLELRDLAERIEHRVRGQIRRRLVVAERNYRRAARSAGRRARSTRVPAATRLRG